MPSPKRLAPLKPSEMNAATHELLGSLAGAMEEIEGEHASDDPDGDASGTVNIVRTIAHHQGLLAPFLGFAGALALEGVLSRRVSELLALRVIWHCQSAFEWGHHVVFAQAAGLSDEEIARIPLGPDRPEWSEEDRLLLRATDELHAHQDLTDETWSSLRKTYSDAQLVEIPFVVGQYTMLSMVASATGVPVEEGLHPLPIKPR
jgi:4-carboxymuconolactone decarboxylase